MNQKIKAFIENNVKLLEAEDFSQLYKKASQSYLEVGELTESFLDAGIDPLNYLTEIPFCYLAGILSVSVLDIPDYVTSMGDYAFYGCSNLTTITIPNGITYIGNGEFWGCNSLTGIIIPDSVTSIGKYAFSGCTGLTSITIPNSVTSIGYEAFRDCSSLINITYKGTIAEWENIVKGDRWKSGIQSNCVIKCTGGNIKL